MGNTLGLTEAPGSFQEHEHLPRLSTSTISSSTDLFDIWERAEEDHQAWEQQALTQHALNQQLSEQLNAPINRISIQDSGFLSHTTRRLFILGQPCGSLLARRHAWNRTTNYGRDLAVYRDQQGSRRNDRSCRARFNIGQRYMEYWGIEPVSPEDFTPMDWNPRLPPFPPPPLPAPTPASPTAATESEDESDGGVTLPEDVREIASDWIWDRTDCLSSSSRASSPAFASPTATLKSGDESDGDVTLPEDMRERASGWNWVGIDFSSLASSRASSPDVPSTPTYISDPSFNGDEDWSEHPMSRTTIIERPLGSQDNVLMDFMELLAARLAYADQNGNGNLQDGPLSPNEEHEDYDNHDEYYASEGEPDSDPELPSPSSSLASFMDLLAEHTTYGSFGDQRPRLLYAAAVLNDNSRAPSPSSTMELDESDEPELEPEPTEESDEPDFQPSEDHGEPNENNELQPALEPPSPSTSLWSFMDLLVEHTRPPPPYLADPPNDTPEAPPSSSSTDEHPSELEPELEPEPEPSLTPSTSVLRRPSTTPSPPTSETVSSYQSAQSRQIPQIRRQPGHADLFTSAQDPVKDAFQEETDLATAVQIRRVSSHVEEVTIPRRSLPQSRSDNLRSRQPQPGSDDEDARSEHKHYFHQRQHQPASSSSSSRKPGLWRRLKNKLKLKGKGSLRSSS